MEVVLWHQRPRRKKGIVYSIPYSECPEEYIGEFPRNLEARSKDDRCVRQGDQRQSAEAGHVCVQNHDIDWDRAKVIDQRVGRRMKEAVHIASRSLEKLMNEDCGIKIIEQ